jgi:hypothetical protein
MQSKMRRNLAGTFVPHDLGGGAWRLSRREPSPIDIHLRGAQAGAADALRPAAVSDIGIEWHAEGVMLIMTSADRRRSIHTQAAIVHEPLAHLYEALPLAGFDDQARRFWRRVFRLVRIPGGRCLLGVVARRRRK